MTTTSPVTTIKRHPIRGFLYGIIFGLGLALIVAGQGWAALGTWPPFIVFFVGIVAGTAWSTFGPAKKPKGAPPADAEVATDPPTPADADTAGPDTAGPDTAGPDTAGPDTAGGEEE